MAQTPIHKEMILAAPRDAVWRAWTTNDGVTAFFGAKARIELKVGGRFEILWDEPGVPEGKRGSEGCRVLNFMDGEMLSFDWNAPPEFPAERDGHKTFVVVRFLSVDATHTRVTLDHAGWPDPWTGRSEEVWQYFDRAWGMVMFWCATHFRTGERIDWKNPPRPPA